MSGRFSERLLHLCATKINGRLYPQQHRSMRQFPSRYSRTIKTSNSKKKYSISLIISHITSFRRAVRLRVQPVRVGHSDAGVASNTLRGSPTIVQKVQAGLVSLLSPYPYSPWGARKVCTNLLWAHISCTDVSEPVFRVQ